MQTASCLNCNTQLEDVHKFCPQCGQKTKVHRLSFHEIGHDAVHYFTHADKSIFTLLKELATHPGLVAREYLSGKRRKYFKPLNFFLIVAGIVVFMTSTLYTPNTGRSVRMEQAAQKIEDPVKKGALLDRAERTRTVNKLTGKYSNVINMVATPFLTLLFWIFYRRRYNYVESLVANLYFVGFIMLLYALLIVPLQYLYPRFSLYFISFFFLFEILYRGFAYYGLVNIRTRRQAVKAYSVSLLVTLIWVLLTFTLIALYIRTGF